MKFSILHLYTKYDIRHLDVRRRWQLLSMMYNISNREDMLCAQLPPQASTRSSSKIKFRHDFTSITRVLNSPLYRGIALWDNLPALSQKTKTKSDFKKYIRQIVK